jgi:lipopolysaccharide export system protein LptA
MSRPLPASRLAGALCLTLASLASAQSDTARTQDTEITSGFQNVDGRTGVVIYREDVQVRHQQLILNADEMRGQELEPGIFDHAILTGSPVTFTITPEDGLPTSGQARRIEYDFQSRALHMTGDARLEQPGRSIHAETIDYNMQTEQIRAQRGEDADSRVRTRFSPENADGESESETDNSGENRDAGEIPAQSGESENGGEQ